MVVVKGTVRKRRLLVQTRVDGKQIRNTLLEKTRKMSYLISLTFAQRDSEELIYKEIQILVSVF